MMSVADLSAGPQTRDILTEKVLGFAIEVHRALGPGLLESAYAACLAREMDLSGIPFQREVEVPIAYKDVQIATAYRLDFLVQNELVLEIKSVEGLNRIHEAQLLTYLRLTRKRTGLLINFNERLLKDGVLRRVL